MAVTWFSSRTIRFLYEDTLRDDLQNRAKVVVDQIVQNQLNLAVRQIDPLCKRLGELMNCRVTVILPTGEVIGESEEEPAQLENHINRPEVQQALSKRVGSSLHYSRTRDQAMMYVALPLIQSDNVAAVVRTSLKASAITETLRSIYLYIFKGMLLIAFFSAIVSFIISRRISSPIETLKQWAERFAQGDLTTRLEVPDSEEIGRLAAAMNKMAAQMDDRIRMIIQQRNQQEAILSSMVEGVIAVDSSKRIISLNQTAINWLHLNGNHHEGKSITEIITNEDLYRIIDKSLNQAELVREEIVIDNPKKQFLQVHGSALHDSDGNQIGSVIVLHDVTELRRLENIRREFVANVSHELKTPITSIKGFVETLLDGAIQNPADANRFLGIIAKQAERLENIIDDLLSLSRVEQEEEKSSLQVELCKVETIIQTAVECCKQKAQEKMIHFELVCEEELEIYANPALLEQALVNLIDNAIQYSFEGGAIRIETTHDDSYLSIKVRDWGCGIAEEHLSRIFERFYRVDKARSRKLGGTGLGLAIVKHITQTHGGYVSVDSEVDKGSTFVLHLPLKETA